jgi:archaeal flagellar protein FlaI
MGKSVSKQDAPTKRRKIRRALARFKKRGSSVLKTIGGKFSAVSSRVKRSCIRFYYKSVSIKRRICRPFSRGMKRIKNSVLRCCMRIRRSVSKVYNTIKRPFVVLAQKANRILRIFGLSAKKAAEPFGQISLPEMKGGSMSLDDIEKRLSKKKLLPPKCANTNTIKLENNTLRIDCSGCPYGMLKSPHCVNSIQQNKAKKLTLHNDYYKYEYDENEVSNILNGLDASPVVRPFFSNSKISLNPEGICLESYAYEDAKIHICENEGEQLYHITAPEYSLPEEKLKILKKAYDSLDFKSDDDFKCVCRSAVEKAGNLSPAEVDEIARILTRCTFGLDIIELMLNDPNINDLYINSPSDTTPVYIKHKDYDDCRTNVYIPESTIESIISKFRLRSGRVLSEVSPILDMELPELGVRVNITAPPISPDGVAFAFRRARERPWTLLKFVENKMISLEAAALISFLVNEESSILLCGDRGSGKTSLLTALIGSMPIKNRILTLEDTFEIPVSAFADKGFRIQRMKIKSAASKSGFELTADEAMRSLLRMGDSAVVMGEVRGQEAKTLYEAMNVGGSGNCVLGTIHGKSPQNLFERVVHSLGVPAPSFKATDVIILANRIRPEGGSKKYRRVTEIVEVRKDWVDENGKIFRPLMNYDSFEDSLKADDALLNGESDVLKKIADKRGTDIQSVLDDINARSRIYKKVLDFHEQNAMDGILEIGAMIDINSAYCRCVDSVLQDGNIDYGQVVERWETWFFNYTHKHFGCAKEYKSKWKDMQVFAESLNSSSEVL